MNLFKLTRSLIRSVPRCAPSECAARVRSGESVLIDARERNEWETGVAEHAVLLSFKDLMDERTQWRPFLEQSGGRELLFYCGAGVRAGIAARLLAGEGFRTANTGRLSDWARAGWPIVTPPPEGGQFDSRRGRSV